MAKRLCKSVLKLRLSLQWQRSEAPAGRVDGNYPQWNDEQHMDWTQRLIFYAAGPMYFASSHESVPDDGTRYSLLIPVLVHIVTAVAHTIIMSQDWQTAFTI
ncbi:UNVERIFIED_CONTAM: hypothetical protein Sangu_2811200 [Sesamum angustifolium]|uniref:Uncharacterized protein n=1 Tax=Sesamum angustifolium TaxID=2727405 RepID=A0AAW2IRP7_9LAMI